jgi:hypothetical protein
MTALQRKRLATTFQVEVLAWVPVLTHVQGLSQHERLCSKHSLSYQAMEIVRSSGISKNSLERDEARRDK